MENYEMAYPYYDPPLKVPNILDPNGDERARIDDVKKIDNMSVENYDLELIEVEYILHFGTRPYLEDYLYSTQYRQLALLHGGRASVLLECLKRNVTVSELWEIDDPALERTIETSKDERIKKLNERRTWLLEQKSKLRQRQQSK